MQCPNKICIPLLAYQSSTFIDTTYIAYLSLTINRKTTITTIYLFCPGDKDTQALVKHPKGCLLLQLGSFNLAKSGIVTTLHSPGMSWVYITWNVAARSPDQGETGSNTSHSKPQQGRRCRNQKPIINKPTNPNLTPLSSGSCGCSLLLMAEGSLQVLGLCTLHAQLFCKGCHPHFKIKYMRKHCWCLEISPLKGK